jgi:hypothetical protein
MGRLNPIERRVERFLREPPSVRNAAAVITSTFVARATRDYEAARVQEDVSDRERIEQRFDELERKIDLLATARENPGA